MAESDSTTPTVPLYKENSTSLLKHLYEYITPQYAADWKVIGTLLGLPSGELKAIEAGWPTNVKWCCNQMLEKWLEVDSTASWEKILAVIESPVVSSSQAVDKATCSKVDVYKKTVTTATKEIDPVIILSEMVSQYNVQVRFNTDEETWPPDQPRTFTPLILIHHQGQYAMQPATKMAHNQFIQTDDINESSDSNDDIGDIDENTVAASNQSVIKHHPEQDNCTSLQDSSKITKELTEILGPLEHSDCPQFVLIEGGPGIGKSILLKEIAYRWGSKQLLKAFKIVLLICLRDPAVQKASSIKDLLQLFCKRENVRGGKIAITCSSFLVENNGKDLVFLFDGYDEYPEKLQKDSLIADILRRKVLPKCALMVSSRPHATVHFRERATVRVDILGFTGIEQSQFIQQTLKGRPQSIKELTQYLEDHLTISTLCVVPFNMVVLLFLYKQGISLPKNSTELYNHFICLTICRHLAKCGHPLDNTITDLTNLPDPYKEIIQQLSKLSLEALNSNKLVFTFDEIKVTCPNIETIPGAINGFGLLQAVQHFGLTGKTITFNFLHFTIQEFLAAYHVANLSPNNELIILKEYFWNDSHSNMFSIYITLTKGQRPSFKQFIKPSLGQRFKGLLAGAQFSNRFHGDTVKCLHLFRCFLEAGDKEICRSIENEKVFEDKAVNILNFRLSSSNIECVAIFLTCSSHKQWKKLRLHECYIQDYGVHMLHRGLTNCIVTITTLDLSGNGLTKFSSFAISKITISCRVKVLNISDNDTVGEDERFYCILSDPSSVLEELDMFSTKLSSDAAIKLFTTLTDNKKLRSLRIYNNKINDEAYYAIIMAMKKNTSLVELDMCANPIGRCVRDIIKAVRCNNSLQRLHIPLSFHEFREMSEEVNKIREKRGCPVKLEMIYSDHHLRNNYLDLYSAAAMYFNAN